MAVSERRSVKELLRAELQWRNVLPHFHTSEPFVKPLWQMPSAAYIVYRIAVCVYLNGWLAVISYWASGYASALMYFTAWGYILLCLSTLLLAVLTVHHAVRTRRQRRRRQCATVADDAGFGNDTRPTDGHFARSAEPSPSSAPLSANDAEAEDEDLNYEATHLQMPPDGCRDAACKCQSAASATAAATAADEPLSPAGCTDRCGSNGQPQWRGRNRRLACVVRLTWVVYSIAVTVAPLITFAYFCVVVPLSTAADAELLLNVANLNLHAVNSLVVLIEALLCAIPSRLAFVVYSDVFFAAYVVANVAFWSVDRERNVLYPVIGDWGNYWHIGLPLTIVALLVGIPIIHAGHYLRYRLQIAAYERVYRRRYPHDEASVHPAPAGHRHPGAA